MVVAFSYGSSTASDSFCAGTTNLMKTIDLGALYDFGPAKLLGELSPSKSTSDYAVAPILGGPLISTCMATCWVSRFPSGPA